MNLHKHVYIVCRVAFIYYQLARNSVTHLHRLMKLMLLGALSTFCLNFFSPSFVGLRLLAPFPGTETLGGNLEFVQKI